MKQEWISVNDQMPPTGTKVLLVIKHEIGSGSITTGKYSSYANQPDILRWMIGEENNSLDSYSTVTHWMELPEPPTNQHLDPLITSLRT